MCIHLLDVFCAFITAIGKAWNEIKITGLQVENSFVMVDDCMSAFNQIQTREGADDIVVVPFRIQMHMVNIKQSCF